MLIDLYKRVPIEVARIECDVKLANVMPTRLGSMLATPKTSGSRRFTYNNKVIKMPKITYLIESPVYREEGLGGFPSQLAELVDLTIGDDGESGCLHVYPGTSSHAEQFA